MFLPWVCRRPRSVEAASFLHLEEKHTSVRLDSWLHIPSWNITKNEVFYSRSWCCKGDSIIVAGAFKGRPTNIIIPLRFLFSFLGSLSVLISVYLLRIYSLSLLVCWFLNIYSVATKAIQAVINCWGTHNQITSLLIWFQLLFNNAAFWNQDT